MFKKISVLVPTRQRPARLRRLLASFDVTTPDRASAEMVFRIDDDDTESAAILAETPWTVVVGPRLQGYRSLPQFFEEMRAVATGDLFMTGNDDMVFQTPSWSWRVLDTANTYPDGIFALGVETYNAKNFPFAIISRQAVELMGRIHPPDVFWGDVYLRDVMAAFGRAIRVPDVTIDHEWIGHTPDQVFHEAKQGERRNWNPAYWAHHQRLVDQTVATIRARQAVPA